jgi:YidC/Oxa1 family membrane protein insertase
MGSEQRNALLAVVLSAGILFGWQYYFAPKKPAGPIEPTMTTQTERAGKPDLEPAAGPIEPVQAIAEDFTLSRGKVHVSFSNTLTFKNFSNPQAAFNFGDTVGSAKPLQLQFDFGNGFQPVSLVKVADNKFQDTANDLTVVANINEHGVLSFDLVSSKPFKYRFVLSTEQKKIETGAQRMYSYFTDSLQHIDIGEDDTKDQNVKWAGIDFNYHFFGMYFDKPVPLIYKSSPDSSLTFFSNKADTKLSFHVVYVKKDYDYLATLGNNLNGTVDFGIWGFFAVWILKGLQFFYRWFPNYGISIILLTFLVRLITFPLQYKSMVSMKKLQLVQPELTKLREKYKDDPARMQKESMELFKRSGANPLGGCLPLLLQMPVFFAFYKVLNHAVELVGAPLGFWIHDLSHKDPFYILPVLMTAAMFLQQKMTPNTVTDPVQKKVMLFMPLIFGFIMKDLPSGLSLYIFVSTILGILQQVFVFKAQKDTPAVV